MYYKYTSRKNLFEKNYRKGVIQIWNFFQQLREELTWTQYEWALHCTQEKVLAGWHRWQWGNISVKLTISIVTGSKLGKESKNNSHYSKISNKECANIKIEMLKCNSVQLFACVEITSVETSRKMCMLNILHLIFYIPTSITIFWCRNIELYIVQYDGCQHCQDSKVIKHKKL